MRYKPLWIALLIFSVLAFNYSPQIAWWRSSLATACVVTFGWCAWRKEFFSYSGLRITLRESLASIAVGVIVTAGSFFAIRQICVSENVSMHAPSAFDWYHHLFQTLNEEIVFGALPIFALRKSFLKAKPWLISLLLAVAFSAGHLVFYTWFSREKEGLEFAALEGLVLVGVIRNNLILRFDHIGYSWALHFGFIVALLGAPKIWKTGNTIVTETASFNLILGSPIVLLFLLILVSTNSYCLIKRNGHFTRQLKKNAAQDL